MLSSTTEIKVKEYCDKIILENEKVLKLEKLSKSDFLLRHKPIDFYAFKIGKMTKDWWVWEIEVAVEEFIKTSYK